MGNTRHHIPRTFVRLYALLLLSFLITQPLQAQQQTPTSIFAPKSCDPDYYESMKSRAWLEAQREIVQNQNLIVKPDSVLEYSCFDKQLNVLALHGQVGGDLFSGTTRWGTPPTNMPLALTRLTGMALQSYDSANFPYTYLGGRAGFGYTMPGTVTPGGYSCSEMDKVWMVAKCMDFIDKPHDGFFTFEQHAADDKRKLPRACSDGPPIAPWQENLRKAVGEDVPWSRDPLTTYLEYIYPPQNGNVCGDPNKSKIPTGLIVYSSTSSVPKFKENVCIVPGCHYEPSSENNGTCVRAQNPP